MSNKLLYLFIYKKKRINQDIKKIPSFIMSVCNINSHSTLHNNVKINNINKMLKMYNCLYMPSPTLISGKLINYFIVINII